MKVLLITPHYACNPNTGAGQRTQLLYRSLQNITGVSEVDVLCLDEDGRRADEFFGGPGKVVTATVRPRGAIPPWSALRPIQPSAVDGMATAFGRRSIGYSDRMLKEPLTLRFDNYDLLVGRYLRPTAISGALSALVNTKVLLDVDDRDDVLYSSRFSIVGTPLHKRALFYLHYLQVLRIQKNLLPRCEHLWFASEADLGKLPCRSESVLPNIPYTFDGPEQSPSIRPSPEAPERLLFVGSYGHRVNRDGIKRFIKESWPIILERCPKARLRIVGSGGWETLEPEYKNAQQVDVIGFCASLAEEYANCAFSVVPLYEGGGTKIKVLESFFHDRLAVGTNHAYHGQAGLLKACSQAIAANESALAENIIWFIENPEQRDILAEVGATLVRDGYTFTAFERAVRDVVIRYS